MYKIKELLGFYLETITVFPLWRELVCSWQPYCSHMLG